MANQPATMLIVLNIELSRTTMEKFSIAFRREGVSEDELIRKIVVNSFDHDYSKLPWDIRAEAGPSVGRPAFTVEFSLLEDQAYWVQCEVIKHGISLQQYVQAWIVASVNDRWPEAKIERPKPDLLSYADGPIDYDDPQTGNPSYANGGQIDYESYQLPPRPPVVIDQTQPPVALPRHPASHLAPDYYI